MAFWSLVLLYCFTVATSETLKNVLYISIDDLRPELGCYGSSVLSPNIDSLANRSLLFERAYCQVAQCAPSRASFLTGRRADSNRIWSIDRQAYWRNPGYTNATTIPQYFKENGYISIGMGKIFHPGPQSGHNDHSYSWSREGLPYYESPDQTAQGQNTTSLWWAFDGYTGAELPDGQIAGQALKVLRELKTKQDGGDTRPFFVAVGFHKPHTPYYMPKEFYDLYPPATQISLPDNPHPPVDMPYTAWSGFTSLRQYDNVKHHFIGSRCGKNAATAISSTCNFPDDVKREIRKSYYACVSYIDSLVGQILAELEKQGFAEDTIVVLTSDHGYHLGEHGEWDKNTNFEDATRVPLLVHVPKVTTTATRTKAFVELIDVFATMAELAGLSAPPLCSSDNDVLTCVEGSSFAPLITRPEQTWKNATFSQFARPLSGINDIPGKGVLDNSLGSIQVMGYSIRTAQYRYTEWVKFDHTTATPDWTDVWGVELYDHRTEVGLFNNENINLANNASFVAVKSELRAALMTGWKASIPIQSESPSTDKPKTAMSAASSTAQAKSSTEGSTKQTKVFGV
ncbi:iduronate 2-sulfatase-like isoform X2 [Corticium candelabrum]|uniref:iduronate 2-sulfatase-like isoform X2 n=1 Tax=Corticium candelabrum TaxID=121492 RepID=UPI002E25C590|nr:iduronate 2-sulfatase-like isoform X2 [Corticium candelabrum]